MMGRTFGQYRIVAQTGRGSAGTVYRAIDETLGREVAIKILNPEFAHPEIIRRFRREATTLARLNHPAIATIHELFQCETELLMVMEFVRGETLAALLDRVGPMPPDRVAHLVDRLLWGLDHAHHAGIVHRDIKPANVMVTPDGGVKIMDFGIALIRGAEHVTAEGSLMGTPAYMALEQVLGEPVDARADLYSVGVIFYRLLTGAFPFDAVTPLEMLRKQISETAVPLRQRREDLPSWCETLAQRALATRPDDRFQSADEFRREIAHARGDLTDADVTPWIAPPEDAGVAPVDLPQFPHQPERTVILPRRRGSRLMSGRTIGWAAAAATVLLAIGFTAIGQSAAPRPAPAPSAAPSAGQPSVPRPAVVQAAAPRTPVEPTVSMSPKPVVTATVVGPRAAAVRSSRPKSKAPSSRPLRPLVFETKALVASGKKYREHDAQLVVAAEKVRLSIADAGQQVVHSVPSDKIVSISYSRGRDPEWMSPSGPAKVARTGGGVMRLFHGDRHWIAMRTKTGETFLILRVDESNARRILAALESRTGRKVQLVDAATDRKSG